MAVNRGEQAAVCGQAGNELLIAVQRAVKIRPARSGRDPLIGLDIDRLRNHQRFSGKAQRPIVVDAHKAAVDQHGKAGKIRLIGKRESICIGFNRIPAQVIIERDLIVRWDTDQLGIRIRPSIQRAQAPDPIRRPIADRACIRERSRAFSRHFADVDRQILPAGGLHVVIDLFSIVDKVDAVLDGACVEKSKETALLRAGIHMHGSVALPNRAAAHFSDKPADGSVLSMSQNCFFSRVTVFHRAAGDLPDQAAGISACLCDAADVNVAGGVALLQLAAAHRPDQSADMRRSAKFLGGYHDNFNIPVTVFHRARVAADEAAHGRLIETIHRRARPFRVQFRRRIAEINGSGGGIHADQAADDTLRALGSAQENPVA